MSNGNKKDLLEITDVNTFIELTQLWHGQRVAVVQHMKEIPVGTRVVPDEGESELLLEGDVLRAYKLGISLALGQFLNLPFQDVPEEADEPPPPEETVKLNGSETETPLAETPVTVH